MASPSYQCPETYTDKYSADLWDGARGSASQLGYKLGELNKAAKRLDKMIKSAEDFSTAARQTYLDGFEEVWNSFTSTFDRTAVEMGKVWKVKAHCPSVAQLREQYRAVAEDKPWDFISLYTKEMRIYRSNVQTDDDVYWLAKMADGEGSKMKAILDVAFEKIRTDAQTVIEPGIEGDD